MGQTKQQWIRKEQREQVHQIFKRVVNYLLGPRFDDNFMITRIVSTTANASIYKVIICNKDKIPHMTVYFSYYIDIRVCKAYGHPLTQWELLGHKGGYDVYEEDAVPICADYLKDLCKLVSLYFQHPFYCNYTRMAGSPEICSHGVYYTWEDMVYLEQHYDTGKDVLENDVALCRTKAYQRAIQQTQDHL